MRLGMCMSMCAGDRVGRECGRQGLRSHKAREDEGCYPFGRGSACFADPGAYIVMAHTVMALYSYGPP